MFEKCLLQSANIIATVPSFWLGIFYEPTASRACSGEREGNKKPHEVRHCCNWV